jgi:transposase-like protein
MHSKRSCAKGVITMGKIRRKFNEEFKVSLVRQIEEKKIAVSAAARKYQISTGLVYTWLRRYSGINPANIVTKPTVKERELACENAALKEKLADLFMQVELLKKAEVWATTKKSASSLIYTSSNWARYKRGAK